MPKKEIKAWQKLLLSETMMEKSDSHRIAYIAVFTAFCGAKEVYHRRFWESVQAGSRIDQMVELPLHREIDAGMFARYKDHIYSIEQVQFSKDSYQLPVTVLSLKRSEVQYDIEGI